MEWSIFPLQLDCSFYVRVVGFDEMDSLGT